MKGKRILAALLALVMVLSTTTVIFAKDWSEKQTFKDVGRRDWSHGYVENLADQDIVHGYGDGTYGPLDNLTRQQAAKMIAIAAGLDFKGKTAKFPDVPKDSEFSGYIAALVEKGAISGFTDGTFRPTALITRSQAAKMIAAAFGLAKGDFDVDFPDTKDLDPKDKALVDLLASLGIVKGYEDGKEFRPFNNVSRAQFAKMLAIAQATAAVQRAEADGATDADLAQAKKLVDNLPDNQDIGTKKSLEGRLDDLEEEEEEPGPGPVVVQVSAISVDKTTLTLAAGGATGTITATVLPANATNKNVTWTSSNEAVATVAGGVVTPLTVGTTTITATSNNSKEATCVVTVTPEVTGPIESEATIGSVVLQGTDQFAWANEFDKSVWTDLTVTGSLDYVDEATSVGFTGETHFLRFAVEAPAELTDLNAATVSITGLRGEDAVTNNYTGKQFEDYDEGKALLVVWGVQADENEITIVVDWDGDGTAYSAKIYTIDLNGLALNPEVIKATWNDTGKVGTNTIDGTAYVFQGFKLVDSETEQIELVASNIAKMTVLAPDATEPKTLTVGDDSDPLMWFNVMKASGEYKYTVVTKGEESKTYEATLTWTAPTGIDANKVGDPAENEELQAIYQKYTVAVDVSPEDSKVYQIKPDGEISELAVLADADNHLNIWFKVGDLEDVTWKQQVGEHIFLILQDGTWSETVIDYQASEEPEVIQATWKTTDRTGFNTVDGTAYVFQEFELLVDGERISLHKDDIKSITSNDKELTPNTDETLWFNVLAEAGERKFVVVDNNDVTYTATLNWTAPVVKEATAEGAPAHNDTLKATYQKYTVDVDLTQFEAMYQIKPSGDISELNPSGDNCLWFKVGADEGDWAQEEGDHIFLVKHGETWTKFVVNYKADEGPVVEDGELVAATDYASYDSWSAVFTDDGIDFGQITQADAIKMGIATDPDFYGVAMYLMVDEEKVDLSADNVESVVRTDPNDATTGPLVSGDNNYQFVHDGWGDAGEYTMLYTLKEGRVIEAKITVDSFTFKDEAPVVEVSAINIEGSGVFGETLTATPDPTGAKGNYQWMKADSADGTYEDIDGATESTYTVQAGDKFIKVKFTATGSYTGTPESDFIIAGKQVTLSIRGNGPATSGATAFDYAAEYQAAGITFNEDTNTITLDEATFDAYLAANPANIEKLRNGDRLYVGLAYTPPAEATHVMIGNNEASYSLSENGSFVHGNTYIGYFSFAEVITDGEETTYVAMDSKEYAQKTISWFKNDEDLGIEIRNVSFVKVTPQEKAMAAIQPVWTLGDIEVVADETKLPEGVAEVDYKVSLTTAYDNLENAKASGRTVTTFITVPDGVTIYYPSWSAESVLTWKTGSSGATVAYGMVGHPLSADNIAGTGYVYAKTDLAAGAEVGFTIKLVDAEWENIVYGEETLTGIIPDPSKRVVTNKTELEAALLDEAVTEITLGSDINLGSEGLVVNSTKTLELAGHTISHSNQDKEDAIIVNGEGNLTLNDTEGAGGITTLDGKASNYPLAAKDNAKLTINGGTYSGQYYAIALWNESTVTINDGTFNGNIANNGADTGEELKLNINGGTINGGLYLPAEHGVTKITDGNITSFLAIQINAGKLDISGGTITGNTDTSEQNHYDQTVRTGGNGFFTGALVAAKPSTSEEGSYGSAVEVNISGGTITNNLGDAIVLVNQATNHVEGITEITVNITGGTVNGNISNYDKEGATPSVLSIEEGATINGLRPGQAEATDDAAVKAFDALNTRYATKADAEGAIKAAAANGTLAETTIEWKGTVATVTLNEGTVALAFTDITEITNEHVESVIATDPVLVEYNSERGNKASGWIEFKTWGMEDLDLLKLSIFKDGGIEPLATATREIETLTGKGKATSGSLYTIAKDTSSWSMDNTISGELGDVIFDKIVWTVVVNTEEYSFTFVTEDWIQQLKDRDDQWVKWFNSEGNLSFNYATKADAEAAIKAKTPYGTLNDTTITWDRMVASVLLNDGTTFDLTFTDIDELKNV